MRTILGIVLGAAALVAPGLRASENPDTEQANRGLEIAREQDRRGSGFHDMVADLRMVLISKRGETSERQLEMRVLEGEDKGNEGDKSLVVFQSPPDVRGTALLTWSYEDRDDDQWLYLPALRRVKRIASQNKSGPFMGSEFAYEDMRPQEVEKYTYKYLRTEDCRDQQCFVVERYPVSEHSGYTKQITWIDTKEYRTFKVEYYDRKKSHLKTLRNTGFKHHKDEWWRPSNMSMSNHQTGKGTDLHWSNYRFDTGLSEANFSRNSLKRAR